VIKMFYFVKPFTKIKYKKDQEIENFVKVEYSKESNDHFKKILKSLK
tara:strand:+ start:118 stop:258 length:141 start_codon:yes stop_codon:yes gene_type:complete